MKKVTVNIALLLLLIKVGYGQHVSIIKFNQLKALMEKQNDTTYVFNFWATWCGPCVKEFPDFQKVAQDYSHKKFKLIFISLDFSKTFDRVLVPWVKKRNVKEDVYLLDEPDYNEWIDKVDPSWGGELPATLMINNRTGLHKIHPHEFTEQELKDILNPIIQ